MAELLVDERLVAVPSANTLSHRQSSELVLWHYCHTQATEPTAHATKENLLFSSRGGDSSNLIAPRFFYALIHPIAHYSETMSESFEYTQLVQFRDTDAAGIMHFSVYFTMMEEAEHVGTSVVVTSEETVISWPRVSSQCNFSGTARFEDEVQVQVSISRIGTRSITYQFTFLISGKQIADGSMTSVCCEITADGPKSIDIPNELKQHLAPFVQSPQ